MVCRPRCPNDRIVRDATRATSVCTRCGLVQRDSARNIDETEAGTARCSTDKATGQRKKDERYAVRKKTDATHNLVRNRVNHAIHVLLRGAPHSRTLVKTYIRLVEENRDPEARDAMLDWAVGAIWFVVVLKQQRWTELEFESRLRDAELLSRAKKVARVMLEKDPMTKRDYERIVFRWVLDSDDALRSEVSVDEARSAADIVWRYLELNPDNKHMMRTLIASALHIVTNDALRETPVLMSTLSGVFNIVDSTISLVRKKLCDALRLGDEDAADTPAAGRRRKRRKTK